MTDNDIIKALECCVGNEDSLFRQCESCPMFKNNDCLSNIKPLALDLINRQRAENERLRKAIQVQEIMLGNQDKAIKKAKAEAITEFKKRLKGVYSTPRYERPNAHTMIIKLFDNIDQIAKELKGE